MIKTNKCVLQFKYCECGCHGSIGGVYGNSYWLYNDLRGKYTLTDGHGWSSSDIGKYSSYEEAVDVATKLFKDKLEESIKCLIEVPDK